MQREIEAKFLDQQHDLIRKQLVELGAVCEYPIKIMRRTVFDYPDRRLQKKRAWVRLREELDGSIELMLKQTSPTLGETYEQPVIVQDYESAQQFVLSLGLEVKGEQESKRELWRLGDTEIMLDQWPWVKPFIEIEAPSEEAVKKMAHALELDWTKAKFGGVTPVYVAEYNLTHDEFESLDLSMNFNLPCPKELVSR